ncbi:MAG: ATP-binding protein [Paraprevotella sp.]|nr:ATP-binding protein [Paraprevotella sp.]
MKIRTALTIKNTCVTATVFILSLVFIYIVSEHTRSSSFFYDLRSEAITKAHLFLANKVDSKTMQSIYLNNKKFINEVEVAVYTTDFRMLYHDAINNDIVKEDRQMVRDILNKKEIEFYVGPYQAVGILYKYKGKQYIVTAAAYDGYGYDNLAGLEKTLAIIFVIGLTLLFIAGYILAKMALQPIRDIVREAENITASNIDRELPVKNKIDEIGELCIAFNGLLKRLQISFDSQKRFMSNVSHELRTPLSALIAELDLSLQKERTPGQYRKAIINVLQDAHRMTMLIDGLLNLAKADYQKGQIKMQEIRLDELLLDTRAFILRAHPDYHIEILFEQDSSDDYLLVTVLGNQYLLNIAFSNLIENNCKYSSDKSSYIQISFWNEFSVIRLSDSGLGLSDTDKEHLFTLFYRGANDSKIEGHGIGMALAQKIIHLHQGHITVNSEYGHGTTFIVELRHV